MPDKAGHPPSNSEMSRILAELRSAVDSENPLRVGKPRFYFVRDFIQHYAPMEPGKVSWDEVCSYSRENGVSKLAARLILMLLERDLYDQDHKDALVAYRDILRSALEKGSDACLHFHLCGPNVELFRDPVDARTLKLAFGCKPFSRVNGEGVDVNPKMLSVMGDVAKLLRMSVDEDAEEGSQKNQHFRRFFRHYAGVEPEKVSWRDVCSTSKLGLWLIQLDLALVIALLDRGLYSQDHREALERLKEGFSEAISRKGYNLGYLLCGEEVESLYALPANADRPGNSRPHFVQLRRGSEYLKREVATFLQREGARLAHPSRGKISMLMESFGDDADTISDAKDFTSALFWKQARFIRSNTLGGRTRCVENASLLCGFYEYLENTNPDHDFFSDSLDMSSELLRWTGLAGAIADGTPVTSYAPGVDPGSYDRVVLILRDCDALSSTAKPEDHIVIDLTRIESSLYRREVMAFLCSSPERVLSMTGAVCPISKALNLLSSMKQAAGYPNPSLTSISEEEAYLAREALVGHYRTGPSISSALDRVKAFLRWEKDERRTISVDPFVLDHFCYGGRASAAGGDAIPEDDIARIAGHLAEKAEHGIREKMVLTIFHMLIQTEFRISQICHLTTDCIKPSIKPGDYVIWSASKTSGGEKESCTVTELTRRMLLDAIDEGEPLRQDCPGSLGRHIFLYRDISGRPALVDKGVFARELRKCCEELGLDRSYTASNLRDTRMTKALEYAFREGNSQAQASILTKHRSLDTTFSHYLDADLEKMLESTLGIIIGDSLEVDADGKVVEKIPSQAEGPGQVVADGCGSCTAESCKVPSPLPCHVCEHFVTTVDHEVYFLRAIEAIDAKIAQVGSRHDLEDLITAKQLNALFLKAIWKKKEMMTNDGN